MYDLSLSVFNSTINKTKMKEKEKEKKNNLNWTVLRVKKRTSNEWIKVQIQIKI